MKQFCENALKYLRSSYNSYYIFDIQRKAVTPPVSLPYTETMELVINAGPCYKRIVGNDTMQYIYNSYCNGTYIKDRKQYKWQKELIDAIEGQ